MTNAQGVSIDITASPEAIAKGTLMLVKKWLNDNGDEPFTTSIKTEDDRLVITLSPWPELALQTAKAHGLPLHI